jgi:hypothetical protein
MRLRIWVGTSEGDDLDVFVVLKKLDATGSEVFFSGFNGYERDSVAKGWLRVASRPGSVAQHTAPSMAQSYSHSEAQTR